MSIIVIGLVLSLTLIVGFLSIVNLIMDSGLYDFIVSGINIFVDLFGTTWGIIFVSLFTLAGMTLIVRFVMSWIGENPGHSANS